jgi:hypothetical protein
LWHCKNEAKQSAQDYIFSKQKAQNLRLGHLNPRPVLLKARLIGSNTVFEKLLNEFKDTK